MKPGRSWDKFREKCGKEGERGIFFGTVAAAKPPQHLHPSRNDMYFCPSEQYGVKSKISIHAFLGYCHFSFVKLLSCKGFWGKA